MISVWTICMENTTGPCSLVIPDTMYIYELESSIPHNYLAKKKKKKKDMENKIK